jgi:hypothetical protein
MRDLDEGTRQQHCRGNIFGIEHVGLRDALLGPSFSQSKFGFDAP